MGFLEYEGGTFNRETLIIEVKYDTRWVHSPEALDCVTPKRQIDDCGGLAEVLDRTDRA
jgi:hypothetical protein